MIEIAFLIYNIGSVYGFCIDEMNDEFIDSLPAYEIEVSPKFILFSCKTGLKSMSFYLYDDFLA